MRTLLAAALLFTAGCSHEATVVEHRFVEEKQPFARVLASYKTASVEVSVPENLTNWAKVKQQIADTLVEKLTDAKLFSDVPMTGGDLTVKVTVAEVESGSRAANGTRSNAGCDRLTMTVDLLDPKENRVLGSFEISEKQVTKEVPTVHYSGLLVTGVHKKLVCGASADQIVGYLESHKAPPTTPPPAN